MRRGGAAEGAEGVSGRYGVTDVDCWGDRQVGGAQAAGVVDGDDAAAPYGTRETDRARAGGEDRLAW